MKVNAGLFGASEEGNAYIIEQILAKEGLEVRWISTGVETRTNMKVVTPDDKVVDVKFIGGCSGNLQGIAKLVQGKPIDEVIALLSGIKCRSNTSCPDQLATALTEYKAKRATE